ncbi:MAG: chorismate mutase, partial [Bacteroidota bacterium]
ENNSDFLIVGGPCSAESESQMLQTARALKQTGKVHLFRAGIWKPRTRPGSFEGVGEKGLEWLRQVKENTGFKTAVEVASPAHVEIALQYGIDLFWIGARTVANPFSVQELAESLKGVDIPVLVKNPVNPDIAVWIGALERFYNNGIRKLGAVHRGFYPFESTKLRNIPKWEIPIELKTKFNNLPLFCDPSHISGVKEYIQEISQKAIDLNMNGLMIESHIKPEEALSDVAQQLSPDELLHLLEQLVFRKIESDDKDFSGKLESLREQIDSIDKQIIELLAQRMSAVGEIGEYKSKNKVTIFQLRRWEKIISSRVKQGMRLGLSEGFVKELLQLVHKESIQKQTDIMNKQEKHKDENSEE